MGMRVGAGDGASSLAAKVELAASSQREFACCLGEGEAVALSSCAKATAGMHPATSASAHAMEMIFIRKSVMGSSFRFGCVCG